MVTTQTSIMNLLVAKAVARTGSTATDPLASTYLVDGEVVVVDESGTVLNSTTVVGKKQIRLLQSQGSTLSSIQSPFIESAGVRTYLGKAYTAPTVQIDYIGYNAVTAAGDIVVTSDNNYEVMIHDISSAAYGSEGVDKFGFYISSATAPTKADITDGLAINLYQNDTRLVRTPFIVERVNSATTGTNTTAGAGGTGTVTFINGLNTVTISGTIGQDNLVAGNYIKFATAATVTGAIYKIVSAVGTTITLDMPYQGATGTLTFGNASSLTSAQYAAGLMGLRLTGQATVFTTPQQTDYYVNRWQTVLRNFGSTPVATTQTATEGSGSYAQMASLEYFLLGNEGFINRNAIPYVNPRACIISGNTYSIITLEWETSTRGNLLNHAKNQKQLSIAFADGGSRQQLTGVVTSIQTVLNAWLSTFTALALA